MAKPCICLGEEADGGHQEECEGGADGMPGLFLSLQRLIHRILQSAAKIQAKDLVRTRRYIQKFTQMRVQLQAVSLRMQALRSNEQMAVAMRGATKVWILLSIPAMP